MRAADTHTHTHTHRTTTVTLAAHARRGLIIYVYIYTHIHTYICIHWCFTLQGIPDVSVVSTEDPELFMALGEVI